MAVHNARHKTYPAKAMEDLPQSEYPDDSHQTKDDHGTTSLSRGGRQITLPSGLAPDLTHVQLSGPASAGTPFDHF